jgi:hypothetical protein
VPVLVPDRREESEGGVLAEGADVHVDRGQRWIEIARHGNVVESGEGHVLGDPETGIPQRAERADGHGIVGGKMAVG